MKDKMALRVQDCVQHVVAAIARIETYVEGLDLTAFVGSSLVENAAALPPAQSPWRLTGREQISAGLGRLVAPRLASRGAHP